MVPTALRLPTWASLLLSRHLTSGSKSTGIGKAVALFSFCSGPRSDDCWQCSRPAANLCLQLPSTARRFRFCDQPNWWKILPQRVVRRNSLCSILGPTAITCVGLLFTLLVLCLRRSSLRSSLCGAPSLPARILCSRSMYVAHMKHKHAKRSSQVSQCLLPP